jgi:predicted nucleic acid-binding Zn ribbon protein
MMKGPDPEPPPCPYCRAPLDSGPYICGRCGRDPSAPRRPCPKCGRVTPTAERACLSCGSVFKSDMRWKVPLIVAFFLLSLVLSVVLALVKVLLG